MHLQQVDRMRGRKERDALLSTSLSSLCANYVTSEAREEEEGERDDEDERENEMKRQERREEKRREGKKSESKEVKATGMFT